MPFLRHQLLCRPVTTTTVRLWGGKKDEDAKSKKMEKFKNRQEGERGYFVKKVDWQTSMAYMDSDAYKEVYGDEPVWVPYRRNYKGHFKPETRRKCIRAGTIHTGSPCPICRDDYLVIDYRNEKLLRQLIIEETAQPFPTKRTGICQEQQRKLQLELAKAIDCGYVEAPLPFRGYDYEEYHKMVAEKEEKERTSS